MNPPHFPTGYPQTMTGYGRDSGKPLAVNQEIPVTGNWLEDFLLT